MGTIALIIIVLILVKTGSLGKAFSFLLKYMFYPILFGGLGFLIGNLLGIAVLTIILILAGAVIGFIMAFKSGARDAR